MFGSSESKHRRPTEIKTPGTRATCCATTRRSFRQTPDNSERKRRIAHSPDRPAARGRKSRMATQPGIAFVTGTGRSLGRNTALDLADPPHERGDAARNRALLLDAARRLIAARGPDTVTMDEIAAAAGVGKGTLFRRFGSRAGLMIVLLDQDEQAHQQAFLFGPAPLGPSTPPLERLLAYGRARLRFVHTHHALLSDIDRDPQSRHNAPVTLHRTQVHVLLEAAGTTGHLDAQTEALLALLQADYVEHQINERGQTLEALGDAWESLARKLCGR
jgi:AcrR family transcriptional regulator